MPKGMIMGVCLGSKNESLATWERCSWHFRGWVAYRAVLPENKENLKQKMNAKELVLYVGNEILKPEGKPFNLDDPKREALYREVYKYFAQAKSCEYNLNKSLFFIGSYGVGKSVILKVMQRLFPNSFYRIEARKFKRLTIENGANQTIIDFGYGFKKDLLIDDLGTEDPQLKLWGDQPNILLDLLNERHDLYVEHGYKTHLITNLNAKQLIDNYSLRVYDRLLGDSNCILWEGKSLRHDFDLSAFK